MTAKQRQPKPMTDGTEPGTRESAPPTKPGKPLFLAEKLRYALDVAIMCEQPDPKRIRGLRDLVREAEAEEATDASKDRPPHA